MSAYIELIRQFFLTNAVVEDGEKRRRKGDTRSTAVVPELLTSIL